MTDWSTISSMATAGTTIVLAGVTVASVRSATRAARAAERSILATLRPVLAPSHLNDRAEKVIWMDGHHTLLAGGRGYAMLADDIVYLAISVRNVSSGLAVMQGWHPCGRRRLATEPHEEPESFRTHMRDLYIPAGDVSFWHGAIRDREDSVYEEVATAVKAREPLNVDLLYSDVEGGQRTISRFGMVPRQDDESWVTTVSRHWNLDRADPR